MKIIQGVIFILLLPLFAPTLVSAAYNHSPSVDQLPVTQLFGSSGAVNFEQVTFELEIGTIANSDWGQLRVRPSQLRDSSGKPLGPGYINVFTYTESSGNIADWIIDNHFVPAGEPSVNDHTSINIKPVTDWLGLQYNYHSSFLRDGTKERSSVQPDSTIYFDLRPGQDGQGRERRISATVLFSPQPLPTIEDIALLAGRFVPRNFIVTNTIVNAEGAGHVDGRISPVSSTIPSLLALGRPPQPVIPSPTLPSDILFPIQVFQSDQPNLDAGRNQCIPMAHANAVQYLEDRYDNLPLAWRVPQLHIRGIGKVSSAGDVIIWVPEPENSLVANIDRYGRRVGVLDLDTGGYTSFCGLVQGLFGYLADDVSGTFDASEFRHQGSDETTLGSGAGCDNGLVLMGDNTSQREGLNPTWEWMFNELVQGRAVSILFSWYDIDGEWMGGHSVRVYGAAKFNDKHYIYTLDDGSQGDNFSNLTSPRTQQWEVADTGQPGLDGIPDGRLNMNGMSWEIDFALSYEAKPTLLIP